MLNCNANTIDMFTRGWLHGMIGMCVPLIAEQWLLSNSSYTTYSTSH